MSKDLTAFIEDISWFFNETDKVEIEIKSFDLSADFKLIFPKLTKLIDCARITHLQINNVPHILFAWNDIDGEIFGWLNKIEDRENLYHQLSNEHKILLQNIGGIQESFNQPDDSLTNNQNFMFIGTKCSFGIGSWNEYYKETCDEENVEPIDHSNLICFVEEANGNLTFYNPTTNDIILFASDHCFDDITPLNEQPEYTFYKYDNIKSFPDYVEKIADEWMEENASCLHGV
ncbi:hypothetical protein [uncultured Aquimarina sp.]|uniref:hypothetical protein n=1 Tax=uncultured Aquimarina sp. TaxID=575652 RepID=UPI002625322C|nr:hypothetical protein [uncultured Aquimarina sp.]